MQSVISYHQDGVENSDKVRKTKNNIFSDTLIWGLRDF